MAKQTPDDGTKTIAINKRASFDYELGDRYEAGLVLLGSEVKTLRNRAADLGDGWISIERGEAFLKGMFLPRLKHAAFGHEERRVRKLLLHGSEIERLRKAIDHGGNSVVPVRLYWKNGQAKVELAVAKGRKKGDKREVIREREMDREARAAIRRGRKDE